MRQRSSTCIQLNICVPFPRIAATPNFNGFLNSMKAPPSLLNTIPCRKIISLFPNAETGDKLSSHCLQVSPKKSWDEGSFSIKPLCLEIFVSAPYQPIPDADKTD